mmetsp:Transcript_60358/g.135947  ORF Transcript_60358/g.135947 Transcript_60358/m.135947 type:complete len:378 (-) Transcript_60358:12-1145(-)
MPVMDSVVQANEPPRALKPQRRRLLCLSAVLLAASTWSNDVALSGAYRTSRGSYYNDYGAYREPEYGYQSRSHTLQPPLVWLYLQPEATLATCPAITLLCGIAVVGFVLQKCGCYNFVRAAIFYAPTLKAGEIWRFITHIALHADFMHLILNIVHLLNTLDLEDAVPGFGYSNAYSLGSNHIVRIMIVSSAYGALVSSVATFNAMLMGASSVCFGLDGALLGASAVLLGARHDPMLESFLLARGTFTAIHICIEILRMLSNSDRGVSHIAHFGGFVAGLCYVVVVAPDLGGRAIPTVPCAQRGFYSPYEECYAFFSPAYTMTKARAQFLCGQVFTIGLIAAIYNTFVRHKAVHPYADGYSLFVGPPSSGQRLGGRRG